VLQQAAVDGSSSAVYQFRPQVEVRAACVAVLLCSLYVPHACQDSGNEHMAEVQAKLHVVSCR
jgi:hypothetical protein